jgi:hypothetical protein
VGRLWIRNDRSSVVEDPEGVFLTECRQDASTGIFAAGAALGAVVTVAFTAVTLFVAWKLPGLALISGPAAIAAGALLATFARELFVRLRRMGGFVLDARRGVLARRSAPDHHARIRSVTTSTHFAPSFDHPSLSWWVIADIERGPSFRVARGAWTEVQPLLERLGSAGIPVMSRATSDVLYYTRRASITRIAQGRLEFCCRELFARVLAPFIVSVWVLFGAGYGYALVAGPSENRACAAPILLFIVLGITVGVMNVVAFYRRSGVFVVDVVGGMVLRNGQVIARLGDVRRFATGNPSPLRLVSARRSIMRGFGPQVLAVELSNGRLLHLFRGLPGDVQFAADVLRREGVAVEDV